MGRGTLDHTGVHRRRFLKLGGATLLAGGAVASTAAARQPAVAKTAAKETAAETANSASTPNTGGVPNPGSTSSTAVSNAADPGVPVDAQSLVPIPASRIPAAVAKLDDIIDYVLGQTGVPGLAAAVVHSGQVLYAKGFGVKDVNSTGDVDAATVFRLASVSKPLSATVLAGVVGKGVVKWTDPIMAHLPSFALADPYVTAHVTYADLFSHVSGLPAHAGDLLEDLGYDQAYILNRLRLEPLGPFRAQYEYGNFDLTAAAVAAATAEGLAWADLADQVLFGPLDMSSTSYRFSDFEAEDDTAAMHIRVGDKWIQKYNRDADGEAAAGGASSNVLDLANWLMLLLANGTFNGTPVIDEDALSDAHLPHALSGLPMSTISRSGFYGYGTNVGYDYAGRLRLSHSGGFNEGAATAIALLPSADLGIVVLTNGMPIGVPEAINNYFLDWVEAGSVQDDWLALYQSVFANFYVNHSELADKEPPQHPVPAKPNSFYTGTYDNAYYGPIKIVTEGKSLHLIIGPASAPNDYLLSHWSGNLFSFYPTGENAVGITAATFHPNARNTRAASVTLEYYNTNGLGTFTRP